MGGGVCAAKAPLMRTCMAALVLLSCWVACAWAKQCTTNELTTAVQCCTAECGSLNIKSDDWCDNAIGGEKAGECCLCDNINCDCCCGLDNGAAAGLTVSMLLLAGGL